MVLMSAVSHVFNDWSRLDDRLVCGRLHTTTVYTPNAWKGPSNVIMTKSRFLTVSRGFTVWHEEDFPILPHAVTMLTVLDVSHALKCKN